MRAPSWVLALLIVAIIGLSIYAYFSGQLPFGLSSVARPPGTAAIGFGPTPVVSGSGRASAGQPLTIGAITVLVQGVQRGQAVESSAGRGTLGTFTLVPVSIQNGGRDPLALDGRDLWLQDERGRHYAVDVEASRSASVAAKRRPPFESAVPPGGRLETVLAFETAADAGALTLVAEVGYGELELPR